MIADIPGGSKSGVVCQIGELRIWRTETARETKFRIRHYSLKPRDPAFWDDADVMDTYSDAYRRADARNGQQ